jgi:hypothetical protein
MHARTVARAQGVSELESLPDDPTVRWVDCDVCRRVSDGGARAHTQDLPTPFADDESKGASPRGRRSSSLPTRRRHRRHAADRGAHRPVRVRPRRRRMPPGARDRRIHPGTRTLERTLDATVAEWARRWQTPRVESSVNIGSGSGISVLVTPAFVAALDDFMPFVEEKVAFSPAPPLRAAFALPRPLECDVVGACADVQHRRRAGRDAHPDERAAAARGRRTGAAEVRRRWLLTYLPERPFTLLPAESRATNMSVELSHVDLTLLQVMHCTSVVQWRARLCVCFAHALPASPRTAKQRHAQRAARSGRTPLHRPRRAPAHVRPVSVDVISRAVRVASPARAGCRLLNDPHAVERLPESQLSAVDLTGIVNMHDLYTRDHSTLTCWLATVRAPAGCMGRSHSADDGLCRRALQTHRAAVRRC